MHLGQIQRQTLSDLAVFLGSDPTFVQGPGGNISLKSNGILVVKASGTRLMDSHLKPIFCECELTDDSKTGIGKIFTRFGRPSIEVFLHAKNQSAVVAHIHSIGAIACGIRSDGQDLVTEGLKNVAYVPYARPGEELSKLIEETVNFQSQNIAILANHGLLVWGESIPYVKQLIIDIEENLRSPHFTGIKKLSNAVYSDDSHLDSIGFLTPDHAVFSKKSLLEQKISLKGFDRNSDDFVNSNWVDIQDWALLESLKLIPNSVNINSLGSNEVTSLRDGEDEKYRIGLNK